MSQTLDPVLDPDTIADLHDAQASLGKPSFVADLIGLFRQNAPARLARVQEAIHGRDGQTLELEAHTLKSNCAMLGATRMAAFCAQLEAVGGSGSFDEASHVLEAARVEFERVLEALADLLARKTVDSRS